MTNLSLAIVYNDLHNKKSKRRQSFGMEENMNNKTKRIKLYLLNVLGVIMSGSGVMGLNPLGMAFSTALLGSGSPVGITALGLMLGMTNNYNMVTIVKYIATFITIIMITKVISLGKWKVNEYANAVICFVAVLAMEIADRIMNGVTIPRDFQYRNIYIVGVPIIMAIFTATLSVIFSWAIKAFLKGKAIYNNEEMISITMIMGIAVYNMGTGGQLPAAGTEMILFFPLLYGAYKYGAGVGAMLGAAGGIVFSLWHDDAKYLGVMCLLGIAIGMFRELGKLITVSALFITSAVIGYVAYPVFMSIDMLKGILGAGVVFIMLPKSIIYKYEENLSVDNENSIQKVMEEKLMGIAGAFERLSKSIIKTPESCVAEGEVVNKIWQNKFDESRNIMSGQLGQISKIIEEYSHEVYDFVRISSEEEENIRHKLKSKKVHVDKIVGIENKRNKKEYLITAKCAKGVTVGTREMAEAISEVFGKKYMPSRNCRKVLSNEFTTTTYVEEANFYVLHGAARKARGESGISGDNYSLKELENGQVLMGISDGMGYGTSACLESETVIELLEQLLDSGFNGDMALKMINSVMIMNSEDEHPATLDYGVIDLHSGICDLVKIGAATTFVKRGKWVETIKSTTMPLGMFSDVDYDSTSKKLYDGDMVIMVSDGVIDALESEDKDSRLVDIIKNINSSTPKEIADAILNSVASDKSKLTDDMTVLVTGIWENQLQCG